MLCVTYPPKGDRLAAGGQDGSVRIWDTTAMACLWTLSGHSALVSRIVYSSQGNLVNSANSDMSVRVWDVTSRQCRAVIQDFHDMVNDITCIESSRTNYLVAGCGDGLVGMWHVLVDEDRCDVSSRWMTMKGELDVKEVTIQDVQGLSQLNRKLLKQRGAVGDAADRLREASEKITTMVSGATKPKAPSNITVEDPSYTISEMVQGLERKFGTGQRLTHSSLDGGSLGKNIHRCE